MSTVGITDSRKYRLLLGKAMPVPIETEKEYERLLGAAEQLMDKGERLSEEEGRLLKLLAILIETYEQQKYPLEKSPPHEMLGYLLEERNLKPSALWPVLGSKGRVSEILSGRRAISKSQAKKLAEFFHVGADLFI